MLNGLSTSTPASNISSADFADDKFNSADLEAKALGDILKNSPAAKLLGLSDESLPEEGDRVLDPSESSDVDPEENDDNLDNDLDEEDESKDSDEDKDETKDDKSTPDSELPTEDDIDWEYKVPVTVDGKTEYKTLEEIRKGYSTDQHLSQKGRELGELKKQLDTERQTKLQEVIELGSILHQELSSNEDKYAKEYQDITKQLEKARDDGDTYTARELKEKQEDVQRKYWEANTKREEHTKGVREAFQKQQQEQQQALLKEFNESIPTVIPDYSEKVAKSIREFALKEGIPESLLNSVYDPQVVRFINDYRKLKTAKDVGAAKRQATPSVKSVPTKKGTPQSVKAKEAQNNQRNKVLSGNGDNRDQLDFLKSISSVSRKL